MDALLVAIVTWLSANFGLPANYDLPAVRFAPPTEIAFLRHRAFTAKAQDAILKAEAALAPGARRQVVSVYDDRRRLILLPAGWRGESPAELSIVVHEMVHHLQNMAGLKYICASGREDIAYQAQQAWLRQFDKSLESEFGLDAFTLFVRSRCM